MGEVKRQDGDGGVDRMFDSEWLAVVSHDNRYFGYSTEDAVEKAVKMTEERMARHLRERTAALERERDQLLAWLDQTQNVRDEYYALKIERDDDRAELTRLRAVEKAAERVLSHYGKDPIVFCLAIGKLAEACGRKG